jgi:hypothetical protein
MMIVCECEVLLLRAISTLFTFGSHSIPARRSFLRHWEHHYSVALDLRRDRHHAYHYRLPWSGRVVLLLRRSFAVPSSQSTIEQTSATMTLLVGILLSNVWSRWQSNSPFLKVVALAAWIGIDRWEDGKSYCEESVACVPCLVWERWIQTSRCPAGSQSLTCALPAYRGAL